MKCRGSNCGNCCYDCCCHCLRIAEKEYCRYCNNDPTYGRYALCSNEQQYPRKYICFTCRKGWKADHYNYDHANTLLNPQFYRNLHKSTSDTIICSKCKTPGKLVSHTIRLPKYKNIKAWNLLELLCDTDQFSKSKKGTLGYIWYQRGGMGCSLHLPDRIRKMLWTPTKMSEYNEWVQYMNNTQCNMFLKEKIVL